MPTTAAPTRATVPPPPPPPPPSPAPTYRDGLRAGVRRGVALTVAALVAATLVAVGGAYLGRRADEAARIREADQVAERVRLYLDCLDKTDGIEADPFVLCGRRFGVNPYTMRAMSADEAARLGTVTK